LEVNFGREKRDAYSRFNLRNCYGWVASCDVACVDSMVSRKELVDISGQGLRCGWKTRNCHKRSRRSPETWTAGGPTLRGWRDLLNVRRERGELTSGVNSGVIDQANSSPRLLSSYSAALPLVEDRRQACPRRRRLCLATMAASRREQRPWRRTGGWGPASQPQGG
jgi:hypothetical protein